MLYSGCWKTFGSKVWNASGSHWYALQYVYLTFKLEIISQYMIYCIVYNYYIDVYCIWSLPILCSNLTMSNFEFKLTFDCETSILCRRLSWSRHGLVQTLLTDTAVAFVAIEPVNSTFQARQLQAVLCPIGHRVTTLVIAINNGRHLLSNTIHKIIQLKSYL